MMTPEMMSKLRRSLIKHEDYRNAPYIDTVGKITIGIGYNLTDRHIDDDWINKQYLQDVNYFYNQLYEFPWFKDLNTDRQIVLVDMSFMGWKKFLEFKNMLKALAVHNYSIAAGEMLNSEWAHQVKSRAIDLSYAMLTGEYQI